MPRIKLEDENHTYMPEVGWVPNCPRSERLQSSESHEKRVIKSEPQDDPESPRSKSTSINSRQDLIDEFARAFSSQQSERRELRLRQGSASQPDSPFGDPRRSNTYDALRNNGSRYNGADLQRGQNSASEFDKGESEVHFRSANRVGSSIRSEVLDDRRSDPGSSTSGSSSSNHSAGDVRPSTPPTEHQRQTPDPPPAPPLPRQDCRCPIHLECDVREGHLIDCRELVPSFKKWRRAQQQLNDWAEAPQDEHENFATLAQLVDIHIFLQTIEQYDQRTNVARKAVDDAKTWIHTMQTNSVHEEDVHQAEVIPLLENFLSDANAARRRQRGVPDEIVEDLTALLRKWQNQDFSVRPHRHFMRNPRGRWVNNPAIPRPHDGRFFGNGHLINGMRWLDRYTMWRDGAHAALQAGIAGNAEEGAFSIVMGLHYPKRRQVYADVDCGNVIYYISTALPPTGDERTPTNTRDEEDEPFVDPDSATIGAKALIRSFQTKKDVRVFRSVHASRIVPNRPAWGYRFDGLYKVVDYECLKQARQIYRFKMVRNRGGQGVLRGLAAAGTGERSGGGSSGRGTKRARDGSGEGGIESAEESCRRRDW